MSYNALTGSRSAPTPKETHTMQRRMPSPVPVLVALGLWASAPYCWAGWNEGVLAFQRGDYPTALREFRLAADQGDASAQFNLGTMYDNGQGVPQDYAQAMQWYRRAANQGEPRAQTNLGSMYDNGLRVPPNYAQAVQWYRRAAEQGAPPAQFNFGLMYAYGKGVPQDYVQAYGWLNLAAASLAPGADRETAVGARDQLAARLTPACVFHGCLPPNPWEGWLLATLCDDVEMGHPPIS
jgi:TPR repeat protein